MVYVSFEDFCEEYADKDIFNGLHSLKKQYPNFKVTMFTIPNLCSRRWLQNITTRYKYIQLALHGTSHVSANEHEQLEYVPQQFFVRGYKPPESELSREGYQYLLDRGYWVAVSKIYPYKKAGDRVYVYDEGEMLRKCLLYYNNTEYHWHGKLLDNGLTGFSETFYALLRKWERQARFGFLDTYMRRRANIGEGVTGSGKE